MSIATSGTETQVDTGATGDPNWAPFANDDTLNILYGYTPDAAILLANDIDLDGDTLVIIDIADAIGGSASVYAGHLFLSGEDGSRGPTSFSYRISDGSAVSNWATVTITYGEMPVINNPVIVDPVIHYPRGPLIYDPVNYDVLISHFTGGRVLEGTEEDDLIDRSHGMFGVLKATDFADDIRGHSGDDTIRGAGGDDRLRGDAGNDRLYGGNGNDTLIGGAGKDKLTGSSGGDSFVFNAKLGKSNVDTITDFKPGRDVIQLDDKFFAAIGASLDKAEFYAKAGASKAHDKSDHIIYDKSSGRLYYDDDGKGGHAAIHFATLSNKAVLHYDDFAIV